LLFETHENSVTLDEVSETWYARGASPTSGRAYPAHNQALHSDAVNRARERRHWAKCDMRLWTIHPRYLDRQGLLAVWREGLLAQAVLLGKTKGYRCHPQLIRFRDQRAPDVAIATYLMAIHMEALQRGYHFNKSLIQSGRTRKRIPETHGQLCYEWNHLKSKLQSRSPDEFLEIEHIAEPDPHPLFEIVPGAVRDWEKRSQKQLLHRTQYSRASAPALVRSFCALGMRSQKRQT